MTRFDDLRHTLRYLEAGEPVPAELAKWLGAGFRAFLAQGGRLDDHLELRGVQGRYSQLPKYQDPFKHRDSLLVFMAQRLPGKLSRRAAVLAECIQRYKAHEPLQSRAMYEGCAELHRVCQNVRVPRSARHITRILRVLDK